MDLLESGAEREPLRLGPLVRRSLGRRPPRRVVAALAGLLVLTLAAGVLGAVQVSQQLASEAARIAVDVVVLDTSSSTVGGVARGSIELLLVNRREHRVRLGELRVLVEGLRVQRVVPAFGRPLGAYEERQFTVAFLVPSCQSLVLPGRVTLSLHGDGQPLVRRELVVFDPREGGPSGGVALGACPPSARGTEPGTPTDLGARSAGGSAERVGDRVLGSARLEIRNDGPPVRLLSVNAHVPGALFVSRLLDGGRTLETDGVLLVDLAFRVDDCARLEKTGSLILQVERFGGVQELRLRVTAQPAARLGPQVDLRVVLDSCD